jgi:hypothetical protein
LRHFVFAAFPLGTSGEGENHDGKQRVAAGLLEPWKSGVRSSFTIKGGASRHHS